MGAFLNGILVTPVRSDHNAFQNISPWYQTNTSRFQHGIFDKSQLCGPVIRAPADHEIKPAVSCVRPCPAQYSAISFSVCSSTCSPLCLLYGFTPPPYQVSVVIRYRLIWTRRIPHPSFGVVFWVFNKVCRIDSEMIFGDWVYGEKRL